MTACVAATRGTAILLILSTWEEGTAQAAPATSPSPANAAAAAATTTPIVMRGACIAPLDSPWGEEGKEMRDRIERNSGGRLRLKLLFGGRIGEETEMVRMLQTGDLEVAAVTAASLAVALPEIQVFDLPYLFESAAEAEYVVDEYVYGVLARLVQRAGLTLYRFSSAGWVGFGTRFGHTTSPTDLRGHKIRTVASPLYTEIVRSFGAEAVPLSPLMMTQGLADGTVEGFAQTPAVALSFGWVSKVTHYTLTRHSYQLLVVLYSKKFVDNLPPDLQEVLLDDVVGGTARARKRIEKLETDVIGVMRDMGVQVLGLTEEQARGYATFGRAMRSRYVQLLDDNGKTVLKAVQAGKAAFKQRPAVAPATRSAQ